MDNHRIGLGTGKKISDVEHFDQTKPQTMFNDKTSIGVVWASYESRTAVGISIKWMQQRTYGHWASFL